MKSGRKYELAQMEIVTFSSRENNEKQYDGKPVYTYCRNSDHIIRTCLVDWQKRIAYNIYTLEEQFPVLEKNEQNFLLPNQNIEFGVRYAIKEKQLPKNIDTRMEYLYRASKLEKMLKKKKNR